MKYDSIIVWDIIYTTPYSGVLPTASLTLPTATLILPSNIDGKYARNIEIGSYFKTING